MQDGQKKSTEIADMTRPLRILILEDLQTDLLLLVHVLRKEGFAFEYRHVITRNDFEEVLLEYNPDVVLSDYVLPQYDGMEALKYTLEHAPHIPFILVTGSVNEEVAVSCLKAGASDYVTKKHLARLGPAIKAALDKSRATQTLARKEAILAAVNYAAQRFLRARKWQDHIHDVIAHLGEATDADYVFFLKFNKGVTDFKLQASWHKEGHLGKKPLLSPIIELCQLPANWRKQLDQNRSVHGSSSTFLLEEQEILRKCNIQSLALTPIFMENTLWGGLLFVDNDPNRKWEEAELEAIHTAADTLSAAVTRAHTLQELEEAHAYSRNIIKSSLDMIITVDKNRHIVEFNPAAERTFGYKREEVLNKPVDILYADPEHGRWVHNETSSKSRFIGEILNVRKNGDVFPARLSASVLYNEKGELIGIMGVSRDISQEKKIQQALMEAEQKYHTVAEFAFDWEYWELPNGQMEFVSPSCERLTGYKPEDFIQNPKLIETIIHPDDRSLWKKHKQNRKAGQTIEYRIFTKTGELRWIEHACQEVIDFEGNRLGIRASNRDITERKQFQAALEESEQKFRSLFENAPMGIGLYQDDKWVFLNPTALKILGYKDAEEIIGQPFIETIHPAYRELAENRSQLLIARKIVTTELIEEQWLNKRGDTVYVQCISQVLEYNGHPAVQVAFLDITHQKQIEEANRHLFAAVIQAAESIIITDLQGNIQYANPAFEKITGYRREELFGKNLSLLAADGQQNTFSPDILSGPRVGKVWTGRLTSKRKDGTLYKEVMTISPIRDPQGQIINLVAVSRDITQEVELEEQLRQSQKLESIGRLVGGIAHDFNNMLTGIIGYAELAVRASNDVEKVQSLCETIIRKAEDASQLINQLLAFSRKQILHVKPLDLNEVAREAHQFLERLIREDIELILETADTSLWVEADATALQQILTNLYVNAQDAMPDGGTITLRLEKVEIDEAKCRSFPELTPGWFAQISVSDTGVGMDETVRRHIFEPFFTTKAAGKGTGLGLSMVYGLVHQHRGAIECHSQLGKGTTFRIYLPIAEKKVAECQKKLSKELVKGQGRVLLIEDDLDVAEVLATILKRAGYDVIEAHDGQGGLQTIKKHHQDLDIVISDIYLPGISGIEIFNRIRDLKPSPPFLFITGYATEDTIALKENAEFLQKPFSSSQLTRKIQDVLKRKKPQNDEGAS